MFLAVTGVLAGNHKQWNQTYERTLGEVVQEAYVTRITFDRIVRQASAFFCDSMEGMDSSMTLYLYAGDPPDLRRYATFYQQGDEFILEEGELQHGVSPPTPDHRDSTQVLGHHVTRCDMWRTGPCIHLMLVLDDGRTQIPVTMTAERHNP
jgi:hypothetical protein